VHDLVSGVVRNVLCYSFNFWTGTNVVRFLMVISLKVYPKNLRMFVLFPLPVFPINSNTLLHDIIVLVLFDFSINRSSSKASII
jgi:hypothetical protein